MGQSGDLAELRLGKLCVRNHDRQRRIPCKFVLPGLNGSTHVIHGTAQACFILCQKTGDLLACPPVVNISKRIHYYDGSDFQISDLHGIASDARLHGVVHSCYLSDRSPASNTVVSVLIIWRFESIFGCLISHIRVRTDCPISYRQIKDIGLRHKRYERDARIISNSMFLKIGHDTVCRPEAISTAPRQHNRMNKLR